MSCYIRIHNWEGSNQQDVAYRFAKVFRMHIDDALLVLEGIGLGETWQFPQTVSTRQGEIALAYLSELGFETEIFPAPTSMTKDE